jgi:uncharacterized protein YndB with AHSA1/START domain
MLGGGIEMEKDTRTHITVEPGKQEVVITRTFDAPRDLVFKAYTDPNAIPQWWGPRSLTTKVDKMDVTAGGLWRYRQRDAQGNEFNFHGVYHSVESPARIVSTFEFEGAPGHVSLETLSLEEEGGKTMMRSHAVFQSVADRDAMVGSGMEEGVKDTYDRFEELLSKLIAARK